MAGLSAGNTIQYHQPSFSNGHLHFSRLANNGTIYFLSTLNYRGGFPFTGKITGDTNQFMFHHLWVQFTLGGTNYLLDPSFKVSEPIQGIDLSAAMGLTTNDLLSAAGTGATTR